MSAVTMPAAVIERLKAGLQAPIDGMGTAFLVFLGLAWRGPLVLGFLDLQASQSQNRFYNELEEWLSSVTRLSSGALGGDGEGGNVPAYVQALLEQTAESLENLQVIMARSEEGKNNVNTGLSSLTSKIETLTDHNAHRTTGDAPLGRDPGRNETGFGKTCCRQQYIGRQ